MKNDYAALFGFTLFKRLVPPSKSLHASNLITWCELDRGWLTCIKVNRILLTGNLPGAFENSSSQAQKGVTQSGIMLWCALTRVQKYNFQAALTPTRESFPSFHFPFHYPTSLCFPILLHLLLFAHFLLASSSFNLSVKSNSNLLMPRY